VAETGRKKLHYRGALGLELFAIRYARRDGRQSDQFIGGDLHDAPIAVGYFTWIAVGRERTHVLSIMCLLRRPIVSQRTYQAIMEVMMPVTPIEGLVMPSMISGARDDWGRTCDVLRLHVSARLKEINRVTRIHGIPSNLFW
jgi:hypothetical protein